MAPAPTVAPTPIDTSPRTVLPAPFGNYGSSPYSSPDANRHVAKDGTPSPQHS
eukprot:CAMPEP_0113238800 /NCGR_PEP_ID=MMETSP0008_2-20120614/5349_1 /TAXON_ID=97485 /ORGANISM="Prymnesium parvum" /LENGTH=52 /DNA_ID=CAMNT_0000085951 /DNA_START=20 /DNA_END=175 /DNA_ORIENTATION=+ /assembly_acc=CAM_ASM_000153